MREALDTVSKVWGFSLEAKWSHCEGRESLPWDITFFQRVCSGWEGSGWGEFQVLLSRVHVSAMITGSFFLLLSSLLCTLKDVLMEKVPAQWLVPLPDTDLLLARVRARRTRSHWGTTLPLCSMAGVSISCPEMPRGQGLLILLLLLFYHTSQANKFFSSTWCKPGVKWFNVNQKEVRLLQWHLSNTKCSLGQPGVQATSCVVTDSIAAEETVKHVGLYLRQPRFLTILLRWRFRNM